MKTIKLKKATGTGNTIEVNPVFIETMEWVPAVNSVLGGTDVSMMSGKTFRVEETPEKIKELTRELDYFITNKLFENEQIHSQEG